MSEMEQQSLRARVIEAMQTASFADPSTDWWDLAADGAIKEIAQAFREDDLGLSADWLEQKLVPKPPPLWQEMEAAFDSTVDDCFYEFNEAAGAMLNAVADRLETNVFLEAAKYIRRQAEIALKYAKPPF
jgi:hypothetical protein